MRALLEKFLKVDVDKPKLAYAIKSTSFEALKSQEEKVGFRERPEGMARFFARGQAGVWREDLTPEQVGRILGEFRPVIERWYPEMVQQVEAFSSGK